MMAAGKTESKWWLAGLWLPPTVVVAGIVWSALRYADPVQEVLPSAETPIRVGAFAGMFLAFFCAAMSAITKESRRRLTLITVIPAAMCLFMFWQILVA